MNTFQRMSVVALSTSLLIGQPTLVLARSAYRTSDPAAGLSGAAASAARAEARARALKQQGKSTPYAIPVPNTNPAPAPKQAAPVVPYKKGVSPKGKYQMAPAAPVVAPLTNLPDLPPDNRVLATGLLSISLPEPVDSASVFTMAKLSDPATYPPSKPVSKTSKSKKSNKNLPIKYDFKEVQTAGIEAFNSADYELAIADFIKAVQSQPNREDARHLLALSFLRQGDYEKAIESLNSVLNINPKNSAALLDRAYCNYRKGSFNQAVDDYNSVLSLDSGFRQAREGRILCLAKLRDLSKIGEACRDFLDKTPNDVQALELAGRACLFAGDFQNALKIFQAESKFNSADALGPYGVARATYGTGNLKGAIAILEDKLKNGHLLQAESDDLAYLCYLDGDPLRAFDITKLGSDVSNKTKPNTGNEVLYLYKTMATCLAAVRKGTATNDAFGYLAKGYLLGGDTKSAMLCAKYLIAKAPDSAAGYLTYASCLMRNKDYEAAYPYISKAIALDSKSTSAFILRASYFLIQKKHKEALQDLEKAKDLEPSAITSYTNLALIHTVMDQLDKARADIDKALSMDSQDEKALLRLAKLYWLQYKNKECLEICNKILSKNPACLEAIAQRGSLYLSDQNLALALVDGKTLYSLDPDTKSANYLLGRVYRLYHRYAEAIPFFVHAKELDANISEYCSLLATCYMGLGQMDNARKEWNSFLSLEKNSAEAFSSPGPYFNDYRLFDDAIAYQNKAIELAPKNSEFYYDRGFTNSAKGDVNAAFADFEKSDSLKADKTRLLGAKANALILNDRAAEAEEYYNQKIQLKADASNYRQRGSYFGEISNKEKALADYEESLKLEPQSRASCKGKSVALSRLGKNQEAIETFEKGCPKPAETDRKQFSDYLSDLGFLYSHIGDTEKAVPLLERAYSFDSDNNFNSEALCYIYAQSGEYAKLLELSNKARNTFGFLISDPLFVYYCLPWYANMKLGRGAEANRLLQNIDIEASKEWPRPIVDYLAGSLSEDGLLKSARKNGQRTEAHCWIGLRNLVSGNNQAAKIHVEWMEKNGSISYLEPDLLRDAWLAANPPEEQKDEKAKDEKIKEKK